jgi:hypothetical protein
MNFAKVFLATATLMVTSISPTLANDKVEILNQILDLYINSRPSIEHPPESRPSIEHPPESRRGIVHPPESRRSIVHPSESPGISDTAFSQLMDDLRRSWPKELEFLAQRVPQNYFISAQASQIVKEMKFGDREVEAALILYPQVVDHGNWFLVEQAITFESDREKLRRQIAYFYHLRY